MEALQEQSEMAAELVFAMHRVLLKQLAVSGVGHNDSIQAMRASHIMAVCNALPPDGLGITVLEPRSAEDLVLDIDGDGDCSISEYELQAAMLSVLMQEGNEGVAAVAMVAEAEIEAAQRGFTPLPGDGDAGMGMMGMGMGMDELFTLEDGFEAGGDNAAAPAGMGRTASTLSSWSSREISRRRSR